MLLTGTILEVFEVLILGFPGALWLGGPRGALGKLWVNTADRSRTVKPAERRRCCSLRGEAGVGSRTQISCDLRTKASISEICFQSRSRGFADFSYLI